MSSRYLQPPFFLSIFPSSSLVQVFGLSGLVDVAHRVQPCSVWCAEAEPSSCGFCLCWKELRVWNVAVRRQSLLICSRLAPPTRASFPRSSLLSSFASFPAPLSLSLLLLRLLLVFISVCIFLPSSSSSPCLSSSSSSWHRHYLKPLAGGAAFFQDVTKLLKLLAEGSPKRPAADAHTALQILNQVHKHTHTDLALFL